MSKHILQFIFLLIALLTPTRCFSQDDNSSQGTEQWDASSSQDSTSSTSEPPLTNLLNRVTRKDLEEIKTINMMLVRAQAPLSIVPQGNKSLLNFMPYLGNERHQGDCGNCFVWSATAAFEIQHNAFKNVNDRISIQYFNSNYGYPNYGETAACNGAFSPFAFTRFYSQDKKFIPWSNHNADYKDKAGFTTCTRNNNTVYACPNIAPQLITTNPHYEIQSLGLQTIDLYNNTNDEIINTIKYYIDQAIPIIFDFCFFDYTQFSNFWFNDAENKIYDLTNVSNGTTDNIYCHSTLITGYNDTSVFKQNQYFEVLNSWGTTSKRPHGTFNVKMNMDFNKSIDGMNIIQGLYILNPNFSNLYQENTGNVTIKTVDSFGNPISDELVFFNNEQYATDKNGILTIPNIKDGSRFDISVTSRGSVYNAKTNDINCYEYKNPSFTGTFNFKNNKNQIFTFIRNTVSSNNPTKISVRFSDKNNNPINDVTLNLNGQTYQSGNYGFNYEFSNINANQNFVLTYNKDNFIFEPQKIEGKATRSCFGEHMTYVIKGYNITDDDITIADFEIDDEDIQGGTSTKDGIITVRVEDFLGSAVKDVYVVLNNSQVYTTNIFGYAYINQVELNKGFKINLYRDGYLFDVDSYEDILTKDRKKLSLSFIMYADNAYRNCKEVFLDLKKLKSTVKKMFKLAKIAPKSERKQANKQQKKVNKLINKLPITAMICKTNKKSASKYHVVSYVYTKEQLLKNINKLQKQVKNLNKNYQNTYGKDKKWLKSRLTTVKKCTKELKNKINLIPNNIYYVVK